MRGFRRFVRFIKYKENLGYLLLWKCDFNRFSFFFLETVFIYILDFKIVI